MRPEIVDAKVRLFADVLAERASLLSKPKPDRPSGASIGLVDRATAASLEALAESGGSVADVLGIPLPSELLDEIEATPGSGSVERSAVSPASRESFKAAREEGDTQAQMDILYHILTGEKL